MLIESIRIRNFKILQDVHIKNISSMAVFIGANGSGKSTLLDIFSFLKDSLNSNVREALSKRGGFHEVVSRGKEEEAIELEFKFRADIPKSPLVTYLVRISYDEKKKQPFVEKERLEYRRGRWGRPWRFLEFSKGEGQAITNEAEYQKDSQAKEEREFGQLSEPYILALKALGQFERFQVTSQFRKLIENWYILDFHIDEARERKRFGIRDKLSETGDNLPLFAQYMFENHKDTFQKVIQDMKKQVPGLQEVKVSRSEDGYLSLRFKDEAFEKPFLPEYVSDGTMRIFAYLLLLNDPSPSPLLAIDQPENQLHPHLLDDLAETFRNYASRSDLEQGQIFISTHSPDFLNALYPEELFVLKRKKEDGFSEILHASDIQLVNDLIDEGDQLGYLWGEELLKEKAGLI